MKARSKFEAGPAKAIFIISFVGFLRLKGLTGTGFAHPKPTKKIINVPIGSRWFIGLMFVLFNLYEVSSPSLKAINECENSWKDSEKIRLIDKSKNALGSDCNKLNSKIIL